MIFNSGARIFLDEEYSKTTLSTMHDNLTSKWVWDEDGFFMNQFGHPYQGSLYYTAARSNGLSFWQSFFVASAGSFLWEEFGETSTPSINDIITTPICGTIVGESLHRIYIDVNEICPALAWLFSPLDALNSSYRNIKPSVSGRLQEMDFIFHGGFNASNAEYSDKQDDFFEQKLSGGAAIFVQYGIQDGHTTKEPFDLFTSEIDFNLSSDYYNGSFYFDGFLYSHGLYFEESEGTLGINLLYSGLKSKDAAFSDAAAGAKYIGSVDIFDSRGKLRFYSQLDGIFLGTRSIYKLAKDIKFSLKGNDKMNPSRFYNFCVGGLIKTGFTLDDKVLGTLYGEAGASFVVPYPYSQMENVESKQHLLVNLKIGYEHRIGGHFALGLKENFIYKKDWIKNEDDTVHLMNNFQIYGKIIFERK